ncbi:MAG: protein kinase [Actinomycetota bacterium]
MSFGNLISQTIDGKYKIERQLGKGGMGTVYLATHLGTERPVAVKVIIQQFMQRPEFVERFRREARAAGRLRHPNVVDVTDFGIAEMKSGKVAYLVMEYLDGCTLGEILDEEKQLPLMFSLDIIEQVCSAVHAAHEQGIIHRDLKPDNIWLEPNQRGGYTVKVLDFGIAKLEEHHESENSAESLHISAMPTQAIHFAETLADKTHSNTITEPTGSSTMISEKGTAILTAEAATLVQTETDFSEKGTAIIEAKEIDAEGGTAIFPKKQTQIIQKEEGTRLMSQSADKTQKDVTSTSELTHVGAVLGTPLYMSPEQCRGEKLSPRSDIYSLGVIAYQMLGGKTPFEGDFTSVMSSHKEVEPPHLEARKVPKKVKRVVMSSLTKDTDKRPQTALAFASRLRASSEGIGALLTRAMTIFSERLPKFLQLAFLISIPALLLSFVRLIFNFLIIAEVIKDDAIAGIIVTILTITTFFIQVFTAAILVGVTTWVVAQILAVPLRPISLRTAFVKVRERWKPLLKSVTTSTLLALLSWAIGLIIGGIISLIIAAPLYFFVSKNAAYVVCITIAFLGAIALGLLVSAGFMLVAPSIMMEGISGRKSFRRSVELVRRSIWTVLAAAILNYFVPAILGLIIVLAVGGLFNKMDPDKKAANSETTAVEQKVEGEEKDVNFKVNGSGVKIDIGDGNKEAEAKDKVKTLRQSLTQGIFEILWAPITVLIASFTSIITALIYFKTRQAGGESMQALLAQFEDAERPKSKWQQRVQDRLLQSGRVTSKP